jgi:TolB protein
MAHMKPVFFFVSILSLLFAPHASHSQKLNLGVFEDHSDVGSVKNRGTVAYDSERQQYSITGSGSNMWLGSDEFHFVWKRMKGNFVLSALVQFVGKGVEPHRKIGWIVRKSLDPNSPHVTAVVHGDGRTSLQFRRTPGGITEEKIFAINGANVLQLERHGDL